MNPNNDYFPFGIYDVQWSQMVSFWAGLWHWLYHITFALLYYEHYLAITIYSSLWIFGENSLMKSSLNFHPSKNSQSNSYDFDASFPRLERVLHDEDKGIGFSRGLSPDGCQTFEMFLPPDTAVQLSNGDPTRFSPPWETMGEINPEKNIETWNRMEV